MSGVVRGVKKVFRKVAKVVKKVAKPLLIAAAVYFTAGLALSAFPATAAFASALPGFAGAGGAGTGIFTKVAAKFGMGSLGKAGGLVGGAISKGTSVAALQGAGIGAKAIVAGTTKGIASGAITSAVPVAAGASVASGLGAAGAGAGAGAAAGAKVGMSLSEKLLLASTASNAVGGLLSPSAREVQEARTRWVGAFYGDDGSGQGEIGRAHV